MTVRKLGACVLLAALALGACGGKSNGTASTNTTPKDTPTAPTAATAPTATAPTAPTAAGEAFKQFSTYITDGQYQRAYAVVHPEQQKLFTAEQYEACLEAREAGSVEITSISIKETFPERFTITGTSIQVDSTAITAELDTNQGTLTDTAHAVNVDGQWRFIVSDTQEIIDGSC